MADFLLYWRPTTVFDVAQEEFEAELGCVHIASNQLRRVAPGDTVWIVTSLDGFVTLVKRFVVGEVVDRVAAEVLLGTADLWDADVHALAREGTDELWRFVSLAPLLADLRFESRRDRLQVGGDGTLDVQQLRAMRRLTQASAEALDRLWLEEDGVAFQEMVAAGDFFQDLAEIGESEEWEPGEDESEESRPEEDESGLLDEGDDDEDLPATVESLDQLRAGIQAFNQAASGHLELDLARAISACSVSWVCDSRQERFAPARFAGYRDMDFVVYAGELLRMAFRGSHVNRAISSLVGDFRSSPALEQRLVSWAQGLLGPDVVDDLEPGRWRFAVLPEQP